VPRLPGLAAAFLLIAACSEEKAPGAEGAALDLTEALGPDEARAGQLAEEHAAAFIGGAAGEAAAGDYLLYNDRARFVIRGPRQGHFYVGEPGALIDLDVVRPAGQPDGDGLDELLTMAGFGRLFVAQDYSVLEDGVQGGAATLRVTGADAAVPYFEGMLEVPGLFEPNDVGITQTFSLEPGSPALQVTTTVANTTDEELSLDMLDAGMIDLATHRVFAPGAGFEGSPEGDRPMLAAMAQRNEQAWAIFWPSGDMPDALAGLGDGFDLLLAQGSTLELQPGEAASYTRLVAVAPDLATLEACRRELQGLPTGAVEGLVLESAGGAPVAGARVFLTDQDGAPFTMAVTDDQGWYRIEGEPGQAWLTVVGDGNNEWMDFPAGVGAYSPYAHEAANQRALQAWSDADQAPPQAQADGYGRSEPVAVTLSEGATTEQDFALEPPAWLSLRVEDELGTGLPSVVHVHFPEGVDDPAPEDERLGEDRPRGDARKAVWLLDGEATLPIVPGSYDLQAHHGFLFELASQQGLELRSGETTEVELVLEQAYELPGWSAGDLHAHASPSLDGECLIAERLLSAAANGLDLHIATDHDHIADYRPVAEAMGLGDWLVTVPGDEISPNVRGHFNIYPVEPDPSLPNGGAPRWWELQVTTSEIFETWRERAGEEAVLQVNHGRDNGLFQHSDYDPVSGQPGDPDYYCADFDVMEILNGDDYDYAEELKLDWCAHLDQGLRPTGVGVSDSHTRLPGSGMARTWVAADPSALSGDDISSFTEALKAGRAVVSAGPFISLEASAGDDVAGPGETLQADSATLSLQILAPSWMELEVVRLYGPGCGLLESYAIDPAEVAPPVWFEAQIDVSPDGESYYFAEAEGSADMAPVWSGAYPYALSNPVFVTVP